MTCPFNAVVLESRPGIRNDMFSAYPKTALGRQLQKRLTVEELEEEYNAKEKAVPLHS